VAANFAKLPELVQRPPVLMPLERLAAPLAECLRFPQQVLLDISSVVDRAGIDICDLTAEGVGCGMIV
jgi:hypothetical protein